MSSVSMVDGHIDPDKNKMTAQEAINFIENEIQIDVRFCSDEEVSKTKEVLEFAISALEKLIPKNPKTEFERIKAMSIDEMAEYFLTKSFDPCDITNFPVVDCDAGCDKCIRKWLESEVKAE